VEESTYEYLGIRITRLGFKKKKTVQRKLIETFYSYFPCEGY